MMNLDQRKAQFRSQLKRYVACVDLEATCTNKNEFPRGEMETIELGIVILDSYHNWRVVATVSELIRPILHPTLTEFCTNLTGITQEELNRMARPYSEVWDRTRSLLRSLGQDWVWCSWGDFDKKQLILDGKLHNLSPLLDPDLHFNMKVWFSNLEERKTQMSLDKAVKFLALEWQGRHHRALDDAANVAEVFRHVVLQTEFVKRSVPV